MTIDNTLYYRIYLTCDQLGNVPDEHLCWNNKDVNHTSQYIILNVDPNYDMVYKQEYIDYDKLIKQFKSEDRS